MNFDKFWDVVVNKAHVLIAVIYTSGLAGYAMHYKQDIPTGVQNLTYAFFGLLGGHFFTSQKYPDPPVTTPDPPVDTSQHGTDGVKG